jgi:hypothetical protein
MQYFAIQQQKARRPFHLLIKNFMLALVHWSRANTSLEQKIPPK